MKLKKCAKEYFYLLFLVFFVAVAFPVIPSYAASADKTDLSIDVIFTAPKNLKPETEYTKMSLKDIVNVRVSLNGKPDALASTDYYVMPTERYNELEDKSEETIKKNAGLITEAMGEEDYYMLPVTFVTYHDFEVEKEVETEEKQAGKSAAMKDQKLTDETDKSNNKETVTEKVTKMATTEVVFCVSKSADEIVDMYKSDKWYESSENGVTWKYTINEDGLIDRLYTESADLSGCIISDIFIVPSTISGIPVVGIGSGTKTPFIPSQAAGYTGFEFPDTLRIIGDYSFYKNDAVFDAEFPASILEIGEKAFYSSNVTGVNVSGRCLIKDLAFANCRNLTDVTLNGPVIVGKRAFDGGMNGSSLVNLNIRGGAELKEYSFCNNNLIKELELTNNAILDATSFDGCDLRKVIVKGHPEFPDGVFGNARVSVQGPRKEDTES